MSKKPRCNPSTYWEPRWSNAELRSFGIDPKGLISHADAIRYGRLILNQEEAECFFLYSVNPKDKQSSLLQVVRGDSDTEVAALQGQLDQDIADGYVPMGYVFVRDHSVLTIPSLVILATDSTGTLNWDHEQFVMGLYRAFAESAAEPPFNTILPGYDVVMTGRESVN